MRYRNSINTQTMLSEALGEADGYFEVSRGEDTVAVTISNITGEVLWEARNKRSTEAGVAEILARWAIEGV